MPCHHPRLQRCGRNTSHHPRKQRNSCSFCACTCAYICTAATRIQTLLRHSVVPVFERPVVSSVCATTHRRRRRRPPTVLLLPSSAGGMPACRLTFQASIVAPSWSHGWLTLTPSPVRTAPGTRFHQQSIIRPSHTTFAIFSCHAPSGRSRVKMRWARWTDEAAAGALVTRRLDAAGGRPQRNGTNGSSREMAVRRLVTCAKAEYRLRCNP